MASSSQSSTSSIQTANTSRRTTRRSNQLVYEGQYDESDDDDYELFEADKFQDSDEEDDDEGQMAPSKKQKLNTDTQTTTGVKKTIKKNTNRQISGNAKQTDKKRKKNDTPSKMKKVERLVWKNKKEYFSTPLPRFKQPGNTHDYALSSPLLMFQLFFTDEWFSSIVSFMNSYSLLTTHYNLNTSVSELKSFISIHIYMGIHQLPRIHMYWMDEHRYDFITSLMSRERFQSLNSAFCLSIGDQGIVVDDPAIHCNDFINHLNNVLPTLYSPGQHLSFDEAMCAYTGQSSIKQYLPMKPHPYGYKMWCLGSCNYILRIKLYEGASDVESEDGKMCDLVNEMMKGYENKHHILYCDNYFTSVNLLSTLIAKKIYLCGSVNLNRLKLPKPSPINDETLKSMKRFESRHYQCNDMSLVMWKDNKIIKVLCNHISPFTIDTTTKRYNDNREQFNAPCPQALHDYFHRARDIDIFDQLSNSYIIGRKSVNQRTRLIWWLVNLCIVNAYTLDKKSHTDMTQLDFRVLLYKSLASEQRHKMNASRSAMSYEYGVPLALEHYLEHSKRQRDCVVCSHRKKKRVQSVYWCVSCKENICVGKCFYKYHKDKYNQ
jgi:hypothetical protein